MAAGTHAYGLHETLLGPQALPPPPLRHALLAFLVALTAVLHFGTAGWSDIHNGAEGEYAAGARRMLERHTAGVPVQHGALLPNEPPLFHWLLAGSLKTFGVNPAAARLPIAAAMVLCITLTFLIGERLSGSWRGFVAGLIQLCSWGAFLWGRIATPELLFTVFVEGALLCAIGGYQQRQRRGWWFAGFWLCAALAVLTNGVDALLFLGTIVLLLALLFREARIRFRALLDWRSLLLFCAIVGTWMIWVGMHQTEGAESLRLTQWLVPFARGAAGENAEQVPIDRFLLGHLWWWHPAPLMILPGVVFAWHRIVRPHEFGFEEALPLCWLATGFLPLLVLSDRQDHQSLPVYGAFALWAACTWERMPPRLQIAGIGLAAIASISFAFRPGPLLGFPAAGQTFRSLAMVDALFAMAFASAVTACLVWRNRQRLAIAVLLLGSLPLDLSLAEALARFGSRFSFGKVAEFLQPRLGEQGELLYEGTPRSGSSLGFYLDREPIIVRETETPPVSEVHGSVTLDEAIEKLGASHPVCLIIHKDRIPVWQERLTARYHVYHQVSTCGDYVLVDNQP